MIDAAGVRKGLTLDYEGRLVKVIGGCLASVPDLSVVWAVLDPTSHGWRGLSVTQTATAAAGSAPPAPPTTCREGGDRPSCPRCRVASP